MGGSMGQFVGEAFKLACEKAVELNCPFISIASSGGARMQEGIVSLMQLPKTVAAVNMLDHNKVPYISVITIQLQEVSVPLLLSRRYHYC